MSARGADSILLHLLASGADCIGEIAISRQANGGFALTHRDERDARELQLFDRPDDAVELARYDDAGKYRPLKTAPNLRHGWRLICEDEAALQQALENFYPARLAAFAVWSRGELVTTPLRDTLGRQSGMYRAASRISDSGLDQLVGSFCTSHGGCLRTILWKRDAAGTVPSTLLPANKYDPQHDQTGREEAAVPLLCQEACNLLVAAAARSVVKADSKTADA